MTLGKKRKCRAQTVLLGRNEPQPSIVKKKIHLWSKAEAQILPRFHEKGGCRAIAKTKRDGLGGHSRQNFLSLGLKGGEN